MSDVIGSYLKVIVRDESDQCYIGWFAEMPQYKTHGEAFTPESTDKMLDYLFDDVSAFAQEHKFELPKPTQPIYSEDGCVATYHWVIDFSDINDDCEVYTTEYDTD